MTVEPVLQRPVEAAALQHSSSDSSGGGSGSGHPLAAAVLAAVQTLAALQLAFAAPVYADGGDFRISSQAAGPEAAEEEQYFETVSWRPSLRDVDSDFCGQLSCAEGPKRGGPAMYEQQSVYGRW